MSKEKLSEMIKLIENDRDLIDKLNFEELEELNKYVLDNNIEKILSIFDEGKNINEQ